jgi:hypothetical protein
MSEDVKRTSQFVFLQLRGIYGEPMCKWEANVQTDGFGGLEVACCPLVPKFAGSNPAETVGFCRRKNPQHAFLRRGSKAVCPMSCFTAYKRTQK